MAQAGKSALAALAKPCIAAMLRSSAPQSAAVVSTSSPLISAYDSQRASMATAAAPAPKQNAAEFVVTKVGRLLDTALSLLQTIAPPPSSLADTLLHIKLRPRINLRPRWACCRDRLSFLPAGRLTTWLTGLARAQCGL